MPKVKHGGGCAMDWVFSTYSTEQSPKAYQQDYFLNFSKETKWSFLSSLAKV